jgi:hypothetical protein
MHPFFLPRLSLQQPTSSYPPLQKPAFRPFCPASFGCASCFIAEFWQSGKAAFAQAHLVAITSEEDRLQLTRALAGVSLFYLK